MRLQFELQQLLMTVTLVGLSEKIAIEIMITA